jgi:hypothetical protein
MIPQRRRREKGNCEMDRGATIVRLTCIFVLLPLATCSGQSTAQETQPSDVVQKLYQEVVTRHPLGVPTGAARTAIWPLLRKRLIKGFDTRDACDRDWDRQHQNSDVPLKAPGFYEAFSGWYENGYINGAAVGRTKRQTDGSYLVYVGVWSYLDDGDPELRTHRTSHWQVGVRVISEDGKFVVDDILGFKGVFDYDKSVWMSKMITAWCHGPHAIPDSAPAP